MTVVCMSDFSIIPDVTKTPRFWARQCWKPACNGHMHLVLDVHRALKTEAIQLVFHNECNTTCT